MILCCCSATTYTLCVSLLDCTRVSVTSGATVSLYSGMTLISSTSTVTSGQYCVTFTATGTYTLTVSSGHGSYSGSVTISSLANTTTSVNLDNNGNTCCLDCWGSVNDTDTAGCVPPTASTLTLTDSQGSVTLYPYQITSGPLTGTVQYQGWALRSVTGFDGCAGVTGNPCGSVGTILTPVIYTLACDPWDSFTNATGNSATYPTINWTLDATFPSCGTKVSGVCPDGMPVVSTVSTGGGGTAPVVGSPGTYTFSAGNGAGTPCDGHFNFYTNGGCLCGGYTATLSGTAYPFNITGTLGSSSTCSAGPVDGSAITVTH